MMGDNRVTYLKLCGVEYPLCFSVSAKQKIDERWGSLEAMSNRLKDSGEKTIDMMAELASILMQSGAARMRVLAKISGQEANLPPALDHDELCEVLSLGELSEASAALMQAINIGSKPTVEAESAKNPVTTQ